MDRRIRPALLALTLTAPVGWSQWATTAHSPANPVIDEGFLVAHDDGQDLRVLSAVAEDFLTVGPTGTTVEGSGDWTMLVKDTGGNFVAYSARHHALSSMPAPPVNAQVIVVEDDVALVIGSAAGGGLFAHAYSANTNSWDTLAVGSVADVVSSRFVAAFREGPFVHGFAARTGTWSSFFGDFTANAVADGNTVTYERVVAGDRRLIAFSGVLGGWSLSPILMPGTPTGTAHNVACGFERLGGGMTSATGYSAMTGVWLPSPVASATTFISNLWVDDNTILVERSQAPAYEALGARPQLVWSPINDPGVSFESIDESVILLTTGNDDLAAFSGLCPGGWDRVGFLPPLTFVATAGKHAVAQDTADDVHAFSAARGFWALPQQAPGATFHVGDAITVVESGLDRFAYSTRYNLWSPAPPKLPILLYASALSETTFASQAVSALIQTVEVYNDRKNEWVGGFDTGTHSVQWDGERNLLVADATDDPAGPGPLYGYSSQRGDFLESPATLAPPLTIAPTLEENLAWVVDSANQLHVFTAPGDMHTWYAWPNGTEYQVMSPAAAPTSTRATVAGPANGAAWMLYTLAPDFGGVVIPGIGGSLLVGTPLIFLLPVGTLSADGLLEQSLFLPPGGPDCFQLWTQALTFDFVTATFAFSGPMPEPAWIF